MVAKKNLSERDICTKFITPALVSRPLKNYLRCRCGVKNRLKMLIY